jgi:hypothetical protein
MSVALDVAGSEGRPFDERLLESRPRHHRLAEALDWARRRGLVDRHDKRTLALDHGAVLADPELAYAAREYESAREPLT